MISDELRLRLQVIQVEMKDALKRLNELLNTSEEEAEQLRAQIEERMKNKEF